MTGVTMIEFSEETVSVTWLLKTPAVAVMVAVPGFLARTVPRLPGSLLICATFVPEESVALQTTEESCCAEPSLKVPVAMNL